MDQNLLKKLQKAQLRELKAVADFCEAHGITYILDSGTLLGAIRHGGFIPWDDDVDICMDVENYRKFLKISHLLDPDYFVQNYRTDEHMNVCWTKIRINGTTITPVYMPMTDSHCGACLDIFIINGIARTSVGRWMQKQADSLMRALMNQEEKMLTGLPISRGTAFLQRFPYPLRKVLAQLAEAILLIPTQRSDLCYNGYYHPGSSNMVQMPAGAYRPENLIRMKFEDGEFWCPKDYDTILTAYYGDWRTPPEESERYGHGDLLIDLEHDYHFYFKGPGTVPADVLKEKKAETG